MEEVENKRKLYAERNRAQQREKKIKGRNSSLADKLSFGKKISKHWYILVAAILFDIFGLIPFVSIIVNFMFGLLLFLYFGPKRNKSGTSNFTGIVIPIAIGTVFDSFISILPINIGAALIRIAMD